MDKKNRLIILIIVILIAIPSAYFGITGNLHELEEQTFYDGIKQISDIEIELMQREI